MKFIKTTLIAIVALFAALFGGSAQAQEKAPTLDTATTQVSVDKDAEAAMPARFIRRFDRYLGCFVTDVFVWDYCRRCYVYSHTNF